MSCETRVGVFAEVVLKEVKEEFEYYGCREHGTTGVTVNFCSQCGNQLESWTETESEMPSYYLLSQDIEGMEDVFSFIEATDLNLPMNKLILFGNTGGVDTDIDERFSEITKEDIDRLIANFHAAYAGWLDKLRPFTESITVKFGVVTEWN